jgi:hypothetical protein
MSDSDHTAIGPALGYIYQFERATYRLLEADNNVVSVAVEYLDDVSVHHANGTNIREQDKATIGEDRPLTDRSTSLWKTIAIWADAVLKDPGILRSTEFHLVTNGEVGSNSLAARIHNAKSRSGMDAVAAELLVMAPGLRHDLQKFGKTVIEMSSGLLAALVGQIFVFDKVSASFGGELEKLQSLRLLGDFQRTAVFDNAVGWVRRTVLAAAQDGRPTVIDRAAFDREARALLRRVSVAALAMVFETQDSAVDPANYRSYGFFQQLEWIDTDSGFVRDCVIHYVKAQAARVKWTDADAVSEASLLAYEEDLKTRWKLHVRRQSQRTYASAVMQGQDRLTETLSEDSVLDGQPMPKALTCGSFHALADFDVRTDPEIGWHPEFERMANVAKGRS